MGKEIWKSVEGYVDRYLISNLGRVKSNAVGGSYKLRVPTLGAKGYYYIDLVHPITGHRRKEYIHRLVGMSFVEGYKIKLTIDHLDFNKTNNSPDNLEWVTQRENNSRFHEKGDTVEAYKAIRQAHKDGKMEATYEATRERHKNGLYDEARELANKAASQAHKDGKYGHVYEATRQAHKDGKFDEALRKAQEARKQRTKLTCAKTGAVLIFESAKKATKYLGLASQSSLTNVSGKEGRTAGGHYVEFLNGVPVPESDVI